MPGGGRGSRWARPPWTLVLCFPAKVRCTESLEKALLWSRRLTDVGKQTPEQLPLLALGMTITTRKDEKGGQSSLHMTALILDMQRDERKLHFL